MKRNTLFRAGAAIVALTCGLTFIGRWASASGGVDTQDKIKDLQKQRLNAATVARDYLVRQWRADDLLTAVNTNGFTNQLLDANRQVFQARLDLCDCKADRIKAIEESIKEFGPAVSLFERHYRASIVDSVVPYQLAQSQLLEMRIALEKVTQEPGGR